MKDGECVRSLQRVVAIGAREPGRVFLNRASSYECCKEWDIVAMLAISHKCGRIELPAIHPGFQLQDRDWSITQIRVLCIIVPPANSTLLFFIFALRVTCTDIIIAAYTRRFETNYKANQQRDAKTVRKRAHDCNGEECQVVPCITFFLEISNQETFPSYCFSAVHHRRDRVYQRGVDGKVHEHH